jgi:chaperonin GroES
MKFKPINNNVLLEQMPAETKTASGIIIPDAAKEKPLKGKVVAISNEISQAEDGLAVGHVVVYQRFRGQQVDVDGKAYLSIDVEEIHGYFED